MSSLGLLQSLHDGLSQKAGVKCVFGDPINAGNKVVIPVARVGLDLARDRALAASALVARERVEAAEAE